MCYICAWVCAYRGNGKQTAISGVFYMACCTFLMNIPHERVRAGSHPGIRRAPYLCVGVWVCVHIYIYRSIDRSIRQPSWHTARTCWRSIWQPPTRCSPLCSTRSSCIYAYGYGYIRPRTCTLIATCLHASIRHAARLYALSGPAAGILWQPPQLLHQPHQVCGGGRQGASAL